MTDNYDSPWKDALHEFLQPFLAFYFPEVEAQVDWSAPVTFLDTELRKPDPEAEVGLREVDVLAQVSLKDRQVACLWIHIEVQTQRVEDFAERMLVCHYRLRDHYGCPILSLGVLGDLASDWRPRHYRWESFGCRLEFEFPIVKLVDYRSRLDELESDPNPFAALTAAHLWTLETRHDPDRRVELKVRLTRSLFRRGLSRDLIDRLFRLVDWFLRLEPPHALQFQEKMALCAEEDGMPFIHCFEESGMTKGLELGLEQGLEQARAALRGSILEVLTRRFGELPPALEASLRAELDLARLQQLTVQAALVDSLGGFQGFLV
ncbi:MAG: hypothetical protein AB1758_01115 [Candidatus Eremiobacterota bacterium]